MEFVFYPVITWLVVACMVTTIHKKEMERNIIIYFAFNIVYVCTFATISVNLGWIHETLDKARFLLVLAERNIILPFLVLIFLNAFNRSSKFKKIIPIFILLLLFALMEPINLAFHLYSYAKWSFSLAMMVNALTIAVTLAANRLIDAIELRGERQ